MQIVTVSPGKMRMKFLRILPEMCAMSSWPFSSLTRNCALASACVTLPCTSIDSSFAMGLALAAPAIFFGRTRTKQARHHSGRQRLKGISAHSPVHCTRDVRQVLRKESGDVVGIKNEEQPSYLTMGWTRRPLIWGKGKTKPTNSRGTRRPKWC